MKLFNAINSADIIPAFFEKTGKKLNVLMSYAYLAGNGVKVTKQYREMIDSLYLDSGAYTASQGKVSISLSEYRRFTYRFGHLFDEYFTLDDHFEDPEHNRNNQYYLEEGLPTGLKRPIPVIHDMNDPFREFSEYVDEGHDYIAIGSNMPSAVLDKIWSEFPEVKKHVFGKLNRKLLFTYKPYSADASTWAKSVGFGKIHYWDPEDQKEYQVNLGEREGAQDNRVNFDSFHHKPQLEAFLHDTFGYSRTQLISDILAKQIVSLYFFNQLEEVINAQSN